MNNLTAFEKHCSLAELLIEQSTKEQLAATARILAWNIAQYHVKHSEITLDKTLALLQKIRSMVHYCVFQGGSSMSDFKWRHFRGEIILSCVRWYCKYGISYRDLEEMMRERGLEVDHTTLYRWVQHYAPEMEKRLRWYWKPSMGYSWRVDETYVKVKGE